MSIPMNRQLCAALTNDLNRSGSKPATKVVDDAARKTFTANIDGAVFEFAHRQPDNEFWNGVKYYGSGKRSSIRFRRTQPAEA